MLNNALKYLKALISDNGNVSMTRFLSLVCVVSAVLIALAGLTIGKWSPEALAVLCGTFLGAGLGAKVYQRSIESGEVEATVDSNAQMVINTKVSQSTTLEKAQVCECSGKCTK